jgi:HEAT repeat protein
MVVAGWVAAAVACASEPNQVDAGGRIKSLIEQGGAAEMGSTPRKTAYQKIIKIGKPAIPYLKTALKNPQRSVRFLSVEALGGIGGKEVVDALLLAIQDSDKDVRRYAASYLGKYGKGHKSVVPALRSMLSDKSSEVIWHAIEGLNQLSDTEYKNDIPLTDRLSSHLESSAPDERDSAAMALGTIGNPRACKPLVDALAKELNGNVAYSLQEALAKIGSHDAVPFLLGFLENENLNKAAYFRIGTILSRLCDSSDDIKLLTLSKSSNESIRSGAAIALGFPKNSGAVERLIAMVVDSNEKNRVKEEAITSLGRVGDPKAVRVLEKVLNNKNSYLRRRTVAALGGIRCPESVDILINALKDSDDFVVMYAAESLGQLGDKRASVPLLTLFDRQLPSMPMAQNAYFANPATVAHHTLVTIMKENVSPGTVEIDRQDQLQKIRESWRRKLGVEK